jgi:hypothetical protein
LSTAVEVDPPPGTLTTDFSVRLLIIISLGAQSMQSIRAENDQFVVFEILTETRLHFFATPRIMEIDKPAITFFQYTVLATGMTQDCVVYPP